MSNFSFNARDVFNINYRLSKPPLMRKVNYAPIKNANVNTSLMNSSNINLNQILSYNNTHENIQNLTVYSKFKPAVNCSNLPPEFEMKNTRYTMAKTNLAPLPNKPLMNVIKESRGCRGKPLLKPIEIKAPKRENNLVKHGLEVIQGVKNKSQEKFNITSDYYYHMMKKLQSGENSKMEKCLRDNEMNNIMINHNKSLIDNNIVIVKSVNKSEFVEKYTYTSGEFVEITRTKRKVIHIPSLKIYNKYFVSNEDFTKFELYISSWKKMDHYVNEIICVLEDDGYEIIVEKPFNGTLNNLIKTCGSLSENMIKLITKQIVNIIPYYTKKTNATQGTFSANTIGIDLRYNVKISPVFSFEDANEKLIKATLDEYDSFSNLQKNFVNYGITLLNANIAILGRRLESFLDPNHVHNEKCCCIYHCLNLQNEIISGLFSELGFQEEYFDFLHSLTSKSKYYEIEIVNVLKSHKWLTTSSFTNELTLKELINLGKEYNFNNEYYTSNNDIINFDLLCEMISQQLPNCINYFNFYSIKAPNFIFSENNIELSDLAKELRIDEEMVYNKLLSIYREFFINKI